jgi:GT2 family glycosyltransferase
MTDICCSIVIVNWKSISFLLNCIDSIKKNTKSSYEIIVIDNSSGNEEHKELKKIEGIRLILNTENRGFAAANNQGFKVANGEYFLMLNPDTIVLNNAIDKMIAFLKNNQNVHAVGPKLYYSEELDYHPSVKKFPTPFKQLLWMLPLSGLLRNIKNRITFDPDKIQPADCVWGAAIMFKQEVFKKIGYLDERFFLYSEEVDFCKRMSIAGLNLYYFPKAEIIHYGGKSQEKASASKYFLLWTSGITYFEKYFSEKNIKLNMYILMLIIKAKVILFKKNNLLPVIDVLKQKLSGSDNVT